MLSDVSGIFASGLIVGCLSGLRSVRARLLDGAADWLAERFTPERVAGFAWRPLAAYSACFANVVHERSDEVLQWCGRELERGFRARRFDAVLICGLQEGEFPRVASPEPFLSDDDRRAIATASGLVLPVREDRLDRERYLFYICASRAERLLVLSSRSSRTSSSRCSSPRCSPRCSRSP